MHRTVISLSTDDKEWLDQVAKYEHVSMTEVVRRAIQKYREKHRMTQSDEFEALLKKTSNIWRNEDSIAFIQKIREEWDK